MKDNYLWDRSGEPDPPVQELEEILGTLRYQPRPLVIPADVRVGRRRSFYAAWAMAAAIALFAVMLGLWFHFNQRATTTPQLEAKQDLPANQKPNESRPVVATDDGSSQGTPVMSPDNIQKRRRESDRNLVATSRRPVTRREISQPQLTPQELAEKEQLLTALRLVSAKLNVAQRRTQGAPQLNPIRNRHKIG